MTKEYIVSKDTWFRYEYMNESNLFTTYLNQVPKKGFEPKTSREAEAAKFPHL